MKINNKIIASLTLKDLLQQIIDVGKGVNNYEGAYRSMQTLINSYLNQIK